MLERSDNNNDLIEIVREITEKMKFYQESLKKTTMRQIIIYLQKSREKYQSLALVAHFHNFTLVAKSILIFIYRFTYITSSAKIKIILFQQHIMDVTVVRISIIGPRT